MDNYWSEAGCSWKKKGQNELRIRLADTMQAAVIVSEISDPNLPQLGCYEKMFKYVLYALESLLNARTFC